MTDGELPSLRELDEVLERAVSRQVAEQRALRQALEELRQAVGAARTGPAEVDTSSIEERVRRALDSGVARLAGEVRAIRDAIDPQAELVASSNQVVRSLKEELQTVRDELGSVTGDVERMSADVEGIAQALIDLNAGLRTWADDVDRSVTQLRDTVDAIRDLAQTRAVAEAAEEDAGEGPPAQTSQTEARIERMEERLKETAELSLYLSDQLEDLDRVIKSLAELPEKVDGVVAQGMRRALVASSKLDKDATALLDEVTAAYEDAASQLAEIVGGLDAQALRKASLQGVELQSQIASLHESVTARLDAAETEHRGAIEALAKAFDALAKGGEPRALEGVQKATAPRKRTPRKPTPKRSGGATTTTKGS